MNKKFLVIVAIFLGISLFAGGFFASQVFAQTGRPTTWMTGDENGAYGPGMMANGQYGPGVMGSQYGGMMNGSGMMSMMYMMNSSLTNEAPLSMEDAEMAVTDYLATLKQR